MALCKDFFESISGTFNSTKVAFQKHGLKQRSIYPNKASICNASVVFKTTYEHGNLHNLPGSTIGVRLAGITAGVMVRENDSRRGGLGLTRFDGHLVETAGMDCHGIERAHADELVALDALASVQKQNRQAFVFGIEHGMCGDGLPPVIGDLFRGVRREHGIGRATLAQRDNLVFMG